MTGELEQIAERAEHQRPRRRDRFERVGIPIKVTLRGRKFASILEAANYYRVSPIIAARRLRTGWMPEEAFGTVRHLRRLSENGPSKLVTSQGSFRTLKAAAKRFGLETGTLQARLAKGWSPDEAIGAVPRKKSRRVTKEIRCENRVFPNGNAFAEHYGQNTIRTNKRLQSGWTPEQAVGLEEPPPRFRNQIGGARSRHWKSVAVYDGKDYPAAAKGEYKLYGIRNKLNGREYIGITITSLAARLRGHAASARKGVKNKLYNAMRHYGAENFSIELLRSDAKSFPELQQQEIEAILQRKSMSDGYNVSPGGAIGTPDPIVVEGTRFASRAAAAEHYGIEPSVFSLRMARLGWTIEQAVEIEPRSKYARRKVKVNGRNLKSLKAAAEHHGLRYVLVHERLVAKGWTLEQALGVAPPPESIKYRGETVTAFGKQFKSLNACAQHFKIKEETLRRRVRLVGQNIEEAIRELQLSPKAGARGVPVKVLGESFPSLIQCVAKFKLNLHSVRNRMRYKRETAEEVVLYLRKHQRTRR